MRLTKRSPQRGLYPWAIVTAAVLAAVSAVLLAGCGSGEDLMTTVAPAKEVNSPAAAGPNGADGVLPSAPDSDLSVTPEQRQFLDVLKSAGVRRSSDLMALSIGSYVCQGRAAGQSDQGVWDFVFPLVRGEIHDMNPNTTVTAMTAQVDETTAQYIRIATDQLC